MKYYKKKSDIKCLVHTKEQLFHSYVDLFFPQLAHDVTVPFSMEDRTMPSSKQ